MKATRVFAKLVSFLAVSCVFCSIAPAQAVQSVSGGSKTGPFGFYYGETREQIIASIGKSAVTKIVGARLDVSTAPKPYHGIESYILWVSPERGLLKIIAVGDNIETNDSGDQLIQAYRQVQTALVSVYGTPTHDFDFLKVESIWKEPNEWMMGLLKKDRYLDTSWDGDKTNLPNHLSDVSVDTIALRTDTGYLKITYEFEGWDAFVDQLRDQENKVL